MQELMNSLPRLFPSYVNMSTNLYPSNSRLTVVYRYRIPMAPLAQCDISMALPGPCRSRISIFDAQIAAPAPVLHVQLINMQEPNAKRQKNNLGSALRKKKETAPDYEKGIEYWDGIEASVDGVLGGFGNGVSVVLLGVYLDFPLPQAYSGGGRVRRGQSAEDQSTERAAESDAAKRRSCTLQNRAARDILGRLSSSPA